MPDVSVRKLLDPDDRSLPVFAEIDRVRESVGRRARELFALRGGGEGRALDDWLQAEREICWPAAAQLLESGKQFAVSVALPGFGPQDIELTATPSELIVHGHARHEREEQEGDVCWSEFRSDEVYRRIELPSAIDAGRVTATLEHGMLKVVAPKAGSPAPKKARPRAPSTSPSRRAPRKRGA